MKYWLLLAFAVILLVLGLNGAAYKNARMLGEGPIYPLALERTVDGYAFSCFGYSLSLPLP